MLNELKTQEAIDRITEKILTDCHDHDSFDTTTVEECIASYCDDNKYCADTASVMLLKLKDGRYAVAQEQSDSSGHG